MQSSLLHSQARSVPFAAGQVQRRGVCPRPTAKRSDRARCLAASSSSIDKLLEWAASNGLTYPKVKPAEFEGGLRGMQATQDISFGDVLVSVPAQKAFLAAENEACPFPNFVQPGFWDSCPLNVRLALKLIQEKRRGAESPWQAWISELPQDITLPLLWSDELLQELQYPHLISKVRAMRVEWRDWHQRIQVGLAAGAAPVAWEEFYWAAACVRTRTFYGPHFPTTTLQKAAASGVLLAASGGVATQWIEAGLVAFFLGAAVVAGFAFWELDAAAKTRRLAFMPVLDLLNHSYLANKSVCYYDYGWSRHVVKSLRDYAVGEQVFMSYGQMSNDDAAQFYGFLEQGNDADTYTLTSLQASLQRWLGADLPAARLVALEQAKLMRALQQPAISATGAFSSQTLQAVRYLLADKAAAAAGPAAFKGMADTGSERRVGQALAAAVNAELEGMPTSINDDFQLLQGQYEPGYKMIRSASEQGALPFARLFRLEKKKILFKALELYGGADTSSGSGSGSSSSGSSSSSSSSSSSREPASTRQEPATA